MFFRRENRKNSCILDNFIKYNSRNRKEISRKISELMCGFDMGIDKIFKIDEIDFNIFQIEGIIENGAIKEGA